MAKGKEKKGGQKVEEILLRLKVPPEDKSLDMYQCNVDGKKIQKTSTMSEKLVCNFLKSRRMSVMPPRSWLEVI